MLSLQIIYTQLPSPGGDYVSKSKLINRAPVTPDKTEKEEESEGQDLPPHRRDKHEWGGANISSMRNSSNITLTARHPKEMLDLSDVMAFDLNVATGGSVLASLCFVSDFFIQGLYMRNINISHDSFLEFDLSDAVAAMDFFIIARIESPSVANRIGFFHPKTGLRHAAKVKDTGGGWYQISMDEHTEWHPPMVPEPSTYGAGLIAVGLAVIRCRSRLRKRQVPDAIQENAI